MGSNLHSVQRQPKAHPRSDSTRKNLQNVNRSSNRPRANSHTILYSVDSQRPDLLRRGSAHPSAPSTSTQMDPQSQQTSEIPDPKSVSRSINISGPTQEVQPSPTDAIISGVKRVDSNLSKGDAAKDLDSARKEIERLREHVSRLKQEMKQQITATPTHHERMLIAESDNQILRTSLREAQERADLAETEVHTYRLENQKLSRDAANAIQSLASENSKKSADAELQIKQLIDKVTRDKVEGRWNPLPDEDIKRRLNQLNTDMRDWAKSWATKSLNLEKGVSKETTKYLGDFVRLDPTQSLPPLLRKPPSKMKDKLAWVLLHAALAHQVHDAFFETPFFCTTAEQAEVLEELFNPMQKVDHKAAHMWRAGLWRLMNPPISEEGSRVPPILETSRSNVKNHCELVSQAFRNGRASILMSAVAENSSDAQNRASKLRTILLQASVIATSLWTQYSFFQNLDLRGIHRKGTTFNVGNPLLMGHPLSRVDVDDGNKFNGRGIVMCARPALIAFDVEDESGLEGDRFRVLAPAIVLLDGSF